MEGRGRSGGGAIAAPFLHPQAYRQTRDSGPHSEWGKLKMKKASEKVAQLGPGKNCVLSEPADSMASIIQPARFTWLAAFSEQLQQVLQQGTSAYQLAPVRQPGPGTEGEKASRESEERADEVQDVGWSRQALEAAESMYVQQLQQEALESVAQNGASCNVSVPFDFWLHVLEKHG
eukprot:215261-Pelagomonas_calceolata.AAC.5